MPFPTPMKYSDEMLFPIAGTHWKHGQCQDACYPRLSPACMVRIIMCGETQGMLVVLLSYAPVYLNGAVQRFSGGQVSTSCTLPKLRGFVAMAASEKDTIRAHWKCFVACGIAVLAPFQYGIDFGMIGGLQAMPGFLKVRPLLPVGPLPGPF